MPKGTITASVAPHQSGVLQSVSNGQALLHSVLPPSAWHLIPQIVAGANDAFSHALARSFVVTFIAGSVAFLFSLALRDSRLPEGIQLMP